MNYKEGPQGDFVSRTAVKPLSSATASTRGMQPKGTKRDRPRDSRTCRPRTASGAQWNPQQRRGLVLGQGDAGRIQRNYHCSPTTTVLASVGPAETPRRSQRERRRLNVGQGGSPVPALLAKLHSFPTDHGLEAWKWDSWLSLAFITNWLCLLPNGQSPEAHSGS